MEKPIVQISDGRLRGSVEKSIENYKYYAFKGIPYAKPPVGELRFKDPEPPIPWKGTRDATEFGNPCAQYEQFTRSYIGGDDCLYLNVYSKNIKPERLQPVMMYIHGGAFTFGCGDDAFYGPDYLLRKDIVLVTINYRLGVFGFLNLEDKAAPGNQGLKDQIMALKWVQTNIKKFGGNPNNVTIFGESSGACCVNFLALSKLTKGLFHKAISQSGTALNTWSTLKNPKYYAHKLCRSLGKDLRDPKKIVEFLKTVDCLELAKKQEEIRTSVNRMQLLYPFVPGVDDKSSNPVLPIPLIKAASRGIDVPYLVGHNNREGIYALAELQRHKAKELSEHFEKYVHPHLLDIVKKHNLTSDRLRKMYDCQVLTDDNYVEKLADFLGDIYVAHGIHKTIEFQVLGNKAPVYFYKFKYDQGISFTKLLINTAISGASHFDELPHLFTMRFCETMGIEPLVKGTTAYRIMEQMTEMWTNFATTGNPTPVYSKLLPKKWIPVTDPKLFQFMEIGNELSLGRLINIEQYLSSESVVKSKL